MIPDGDVACIRDMDTCFLTPDAGDIIFNYCYQNPSCVMTSYCNRIHSLAKEQLLNVFPLESSDISQHINSALIQKEVAYSTTPLTGPLSGFLMLIPKSVWQKVPFREGVGLLGVDTHFFRDIRAAGIPILRCDGLYLFHIYRLNKDIKDTKHLQ